MRFIVSCLSILLLSTSSAIVAQERLRICATVPELGSLARYIVGEEAEIFVFAKGSDNPHHLEVRPGFVRQLAAADLLILVGMDLEVGWLPVLQIESRNRKIQTGGSGVLDISIGIQPLEVPVGIVDRSMGDVHPGGNPHYLCDPIGGLHAALRIKEKLIELRPAHAERWEMNYLHFYKRWCGEMVGTELAEIYPAEKLSQLYIGGKLFPFLEQRGKRAALSGWLGKFAPHHGAWLVDDHSSWAYFARTFGLKILAHLEPLPGVSPTSRHLINVVKEMKARNIRTLLTSAYYDPKSARMVAEKTGAKIAILAHQAGALPGTEDYFDFVNYNVNRLTEILGKTP